MPTPKRRRNKQDALFAQVAAFLATQGKEMPSVDSATDRDYRSNDAVIVFAHHPAGFKPGICKNCGGVFATNRKSVGFCSDPCRREDWRKTTGLEWRAISTHDVWEGDPPLIISPEQFEKMRAIAAWFNTNRTMLDTLVEKPSTQAPELEFLSPAESDPEDSEDFDPQEIAEELFQRGLVTEEEFVATSASESQEFLPTNPHHEPSASSLELTDEEASLFEF